ncbi:MAG: hypothetical protein AAB522_00355 [Patescibacteria group bacterium]
MIVYFLIFILSTGGISVLALRRKEEIAQFNFATFMDNIVSKILEWWYSEAHSYFLKILEKYLRKSRIWVLKMESFLFRKARAIRNISEKNENSNGNGNGFHSNDTTNTQ